MRCIRLLEIVVIASAKPSGIDQDGAVYQPASSDGHPAGRRLDKRGVGE